MLKVAPSQLIEVVYGVSVIRLLMKPFYDALSLDILWGFLISSYIFSQD
jgi:hypothetical protein